MRCACLSCKFKFLYEKAVQVFGLLGRDEGREMGEGREKGMGGMRRGGRVEMRKEGWSLEFGEGEQGRDREGVGGG